jgi:NAD(P)-dependent dehydrogenase (short-subunit alcohol dehydrogenase family)
MGERLKGKVAIVTGAGSTDDGWGNGKATAVLYAREGAKVLLVDLNEQAVLSTRAIIDKEGGASAHLVADVSDPAQVKSIIDTCMRNFGRVDVLHNNVGIFDMGSVCDIGVDDWDRYFVVNTKSVFLMCKAALPIMMDQGAGSIVNVSTISSIRYTSPCVTYSASKAAVNQLTQSIAIRYGKNGIRANTILPGYLDTPLITSHIRRARGDKAMEAAMRQRDAVVPTPKVGTAWDVAYAGVFLASDESRYVNGVELNVDGGMHCVTLTTDTIAMAERA